MAKHIMVTGGAGFIGSHLCTRLVDEGAQVYCVDDFSTGLESNLERIQGAPNLQIIRQDIVRAPLSDYPQGLDQIYNLACPASPPQYQRDPVQTFKTAAIGTLNLLELARHQGARFLQASTSEVYGDPLVHPQTEDYRGNVRPYGPRACYDEGKRSAEALVHDYHHAYGLDVRIARIFNTYGPRMRRDDGRAVSNFLYQALQGQPLTLYGTGQQTRSFCYVSDTVEGLVRLMDLQGEGFIGPVNLGNDTEITLNNLALTVKEITRSSSVIEYHPLPADDPTRRKPCIKRARALLGWGPQIGLEAGLRLTVDAIRGEFNARILESVGRG